MQKRLLPHIAAILTFAVLTVLYFLPYYQGQTLSQGDVTQWEGMSKEIVDWNNAHPGDPALWTNAMFGGMPAFQISMYYTGNFVDQIFHFLGVLFPGPCVSIFLMMAGFYIMLLCLDVSPWLSLAGALAYGFSSFTMISIQAGHNTKVQAMSLMAPILGSLILAYRKNIFLGGALMALFLSMSIDSNHLQITYYMMLVVGMSVVYFFIDSIIEKQLPNFFKASTVLVIAAILAVLPNVAGLWSTQDYAKETIRGGSSELTQKKAATAGGGLDFEYASRWSYGFMDGEILSLMIPDIKGGGGGNTLSDGDKLVQRLSGNGYPVEQVKKYVASVLYWGNQPFTSGPVYFGAAVIFLFIFSLLIVRSHIRWLLVALTVFSILLAAGHNTPFFKWMFDLLPVFNKFRTPAMALVIAQLTMPMLALIGLNEVLSGKISTDELLKKLKIAGGIAAGIVILFGVLGGIFFSFSGPGDIKIGQGNPEMVSLLKDERASLLRGDAFRSLFFIAASFALLWFFIKKKLTSQMLIGGFAVLFLLDGWIVAKRYLNSGDFVEESKYTSTNHSPSQADLDIMKDTDPDYRVLNVTGDIFNEASTSYFHKSVGGYHAAKLIRYQDLIENQISKNNTHVLDMLNTKYIIGENQSKQPMAQRNPGALGNAWFVNEIKWAKNADDEMAALTDFDPKNTAVVDERYKKAVGNWQPVPDSSPAAIKLLKYSPNQLTYASNSATERVAVFSEIYYDDKKGWNAYLDGKKADHFRTDYVLRGMVIPAGAHNIEFKFEPRSVVDGIKINYAGSFLLFAFVLGALGFSGYRKMKEIESLPKVEAKQAATPSAKPAKKK